MKIRSAEQYKRQQETRRRPPKVTRVKNRTGLKPEHFRRFVDMDQIWGIVRDDEGRITNVGNAVRATA